jgi:hypothetical protein
MTRFKGLERIEAALENGVGEEPDWAVRYGHLSHRASVQSNRAHRL